MCLSKIQIFANICSIGHQNGNAPSASEDIYIKFVVPDFLRILYIKYFLRILINMQNTLQNELLSIASSKFNKHFWYFVYCQNLYRIQFVLTKVTLPIPASNNFIKSLKNLLETVTRELDNLALGSEQDFDPAPDLFLWIDSQPDWESKSVF